MSQMFFKNLLIYLFKFMINTIFQKYIIYIFLLKHMEILKKILIGGRGEDEENTRNLSSIK